MRPEVSKPSENYLPLIATLGAVAFLSQFAFSSGVRKQILNRDQADVWDGSTEHLEAAHIDHSRSNPNYNTPSNGRILKARNHYLDHYNRAGRNGLPIPGNDAALRLIWKRLTEQEREGLPPPPEERIGRV